MPETTKAPLVRLAQQDTTLGNLTANLERHLVEIEAAVEDGVDVLFFPELSLTGYFLKDQTSEVAIPRDHELLQPLLERSKNISIGLGSSSYPRMGVSTTLMGSSRTESSSTSTARSTW